MRWFQIAPQKPILFKRLLMLSFLAIMLAVLSAMITITVTSVRTFQKQTRRSSATLLNFYNEELDANTGDLQNSIQNMYTSSTNFAYLATGHCSNNEKLISSYLLRTQINGTVPYDGIMMVFCPDNDISIWQIGSGFNTNDFNTNYALEKNLEAYTQSLPASKMYHWNLYKQDGKALLLLPFRKKDLYLVAGIDLSKFIFTHGSFEGSREYDVAFYDNENILTNHEVLASHDIDIDTLKNGKYNFFTDLRYIIQTSQVGNLPICIASVMPIKEYMLQYRPFLILMLFVFLVLSVFVLYIFRRLQCILAYPLNRIAVASEVLSDPDNNQPFLSEVNTSHISELNHINSALAKLVDQKVTLARESQKRKLEQEHAQLQYFQLQTRSHFFINCLKSLYNMLEMNEYDKMRRMILDFSDHIRFIFHDNLSLISLREELEEVNNYANIVRIDSSFPLILIQKIPSELNDCRVPPLLIQTFLENSVKYNGQYHKMLRFVIDCEFAENEGRKYVRIKLSDNGIGYDANMLKKLNFDADSTYEQHHVGISNLKRRMQILYQNDCNLAFFNDSEVGGALVMIYIPISKNGE